MAILTLSEYYTTYNIKCTNKCYCQYAKRRKYKTVANATDKTRNTRYNIIVARSYTPNKLLLNERLKGDFMTKANINKIVLTMVKEMYYSADIMHVSGSTISDEYRDWKEVGKLGECFTISEGKWHIEYDEESHDIWFWKTKYNNDNKAVGYIPKYSVDTNGKTQIEICAELGYWLMQIRINEMK